MKKAGLRSFGSRAEFALLRFLSVFLATVDSLLNVRWGERTLERMAGRWQERITQLDENLAHLEKERENLEHQAEAIALHVATFRLGSRTLSGDALRFDPADPHDERILDATIDLLVKRKLAAIEPEEIEPGHFAYSLDLDWMAIHARISEAAGLANAEMAEMFQESLQFIEENLFPRQDNLGQQIPAYPSKE
jgi:hypothetical protein